MIRVRLGALVLLAGLGYALISIREKLKAEYIGTPGPELAKMRKEGVEIQYRLEVPQVAFLGDTTAAHDGTEYDGHFKFAATHVANS